MKKLILDELIILSIQEKAARRVKFDKHRTLIYGSNSTGKSSLIKSIYKTFGAEASKVSKTWHDLNPYTFVKFRVDDKLYSILQYDGRYAVFDKNDTLIGAFHSITSELTPFLAEILDFKVKIRNRSGEMIIPPPQYMFLPYYVDQDVSWTSNWSSFSNLQQLPNWKDDVVSYFSGIRPNEYYEIRGQINNLENKIKLLTDERQILHTTIEKINKQAPIVDFNLDMNDFKVEIELLLKECESLQLNQSVLKDKLVNYHNIKSNILDQIEITKRAQIEVSSDYNYATTKIVEDFIECPTCGAGYDNSFAERFSIAKDEDKCRDLLLTLNTELVEIENRIVKAKETYDENIKKLTNITDILNTKKESIKLKDLLKLEGKKEIKHAITDEIDTLSVDLGNLDNKLQELKKELEKYKNVEKKNEIQEQYDQYMFNYLHTLNVELNENAYQRINSEIKMVGSEFPRALLAYYFSIFNIMQDNSSSVFCPLIIDSPNQQAQDPKNIKTILEFIKDNQPEDSQLILGLEEDYGIDFECPVISLSKTYGMLEKDQYDAVSKDLSHYIDSVTKI